MSNNVPGLIPTLEEAESDLDYLNNLVQEAIAEGEREDDNLLDAELFKARWDGRQSINLYVLDSPACDEGSFLFSDSVANLTGA